MKNLVRSQLLALVVFVIGSTAWAEFGVKPPQVNAPQVTAPSLKAPGTPAQKIAGMKQNCGPQIQQYCNGKPANELWSCLKGVKDQLPANCKASVPDKI